MTQFLPLLIETKAVISNLYGPEILPHLVSISKQKGSTDCGLFAVAITTILALGLDPAGIICQQNSLHYHLVKYLENGKFTTFPTAPPPPCV